MKTHSWHWLLGLLVVLGLAGPGLAKEAKDHAKKDEVFLEDVIFDPSYLKKFLGPKTLLLRGLGKPVPPEALQALKDTGLGEKTQFFVEPADISTPPLVSSVPHNYPKGHLLQRDRIKASYFAFVDKDGWVKCVYCYANTDRVFAFAGAMAIRQWRYAQLKIKGVVVPFLVEITYDPSLSDSTLNGMRGPKSSLSMPGNPSPPRPIRPPSTGGNPVPKP